MLWGHQSYPLRCVSASRRPDVRIRAAGSLLILLLGLQVLNSHEPHNETEIAGPLDSSVVVGDAQFPEAIPPFCPDLERNTDTKLTPAVPVHLEIVVDDQRSWATNAFGAYLGLGETEAITDQFKGNYGTTIASTYADGRRCIDRAQIRLQGDWGDHLRFGPSGIETSLDVQLELGHIAGITHFKLFLPETRNGNNEVFVTTLASEIGLLAPETFFIDATVNGAEVRYIFQEKFRNELLHNNQIPESPSFQGDERFGHGWTWYKDTEEVRSNQSLFWMSRLSNPHYAELGPTARAIAEEGLSRLNQAYAQDTGQGTSTVGSDLISGILSNTELSVFGRSDSDTVNEVTRYSALLLAIGDDGTGFYHGLASHNQRFVYDPWLGTVRPIYYDGGVHLLDHTEDFLRRIGNLVKDLVDYPEPVILVTPATAKAAEILRQELALLDLQSFSRLLSRRGTEIEDEELRKLIGAGGVIDNGLQAIALSAGPIPSDRLTAELFSGLHAPGIRLVFGSHPSGQYTSCPIGAEPCELLRLSPAEQVSLLRGRLNIDQIDYLYVGNSYSAYQSGRPQPDRLDEGWKHQTLAGTTTLSTNQPFDIRIDPSRQVLELIGGQFGSRAVIWNGQLDDWTIIFEGGDLAQPEGPTDPERFDHRGLTGCLTFRDVRLSNISVISRGGSCEDSIHFLRTRGDLALVDVSDATADAVDMDFSDLTVNDLLVVEAGNDCLDVSAGTYSVTSARLHGCADKGVSAGESAQSVFVTLFVTDAAVGIASKDSSLSKVQRAVFDEVVICAMAYRKKQSFSGGRLFLEESTCDSDDYREQEGSILVIGKT